MNITDNHSRSLVIVWLVLLILAGGWLRIHGVNEYYYSADELQHIAISKAGTLKEVMEFSKFETHPPYPQILRHYLLYISDAPWFLRGESAVFGVLCILVYYFIGRQLAGPLAGCIAAYLITFGYGSILQSQIVRNYSLLALTLGLTFYYYQRFLASRKTFYLVAYVLCGLAALMTHYSAIFAVGCMGICGAANLLLRKNTKSILPLWLLANGILGIYIAYIYAVDIRHNAYEIPFALNNHIASQAPYNSLSYRLELFFAFIPATVSYFLYSGFTEQLNIPSVLLFIFAMVGIYVFSLGRAVFWEAVIALSLGGVLLMANIYPYAFRIAGRHAMWLLPYVIIPISLFGAYILRQLLVIFSDQLTKRKWMIPIGIVIIVAGGIFINSDERFWDEKREDQLSNVQAQQVNTFLSTLTSEDMVVSGGLNMMYILPDTVNYYRYRTLLQSDKAAWYYSFTQGNAHIIHTKDFPPIIKGQFASLQEVMTQLQAAGELQHISKVWFFNLNSSAWDATRCKSIPTPKVEFYHSGDEHIKDAEPVAEFIGMTSDTIQQYIINPGTRLPDCGK